MTVSAGAGHPSARSPQESVAALAATLEGIDRVADPIAWATAAYKLGMATAEEPTAQPQMALRQALELYQQAADVFTAARAPVEHARILNAAGSAHRLLGDNATAGQLFERASALLADRGAAAEEASALNNLGLVLAERGRVDDAIGVFDRSLAALEAVDADDANRTRVTTMHNIAQAHMSQGTPGGFTAAIDVLEIAASEASGADVSMHIGMIDHSLGVAHKALASFGDELEAPHIDRAIAAFERSLTVFTAVGFPMHHAIAKHNLGHAFAGRDDIDSLRRAVAAYEDALNIFDPRLHQAHWQAVQQNAEALDARLLQIEPAADRADHVAALAGSMTDDERLSFIRQRLLQLERFPDKHREDRLTTFAHAVITQPPESFVATLRTLVTVLMELPELTLEIALRAQLRAHAQLEAHERRAADFVLDEVIHSLLFGPQRVRVRDILTDIGWERP